MQWKEIYSCNIPSIDAQHKQLIHLGDKLYTLALEYSFETSNHELTAIFQELKSYAFNHFNEEEALMTQYNYPDLEAHQREHQTFRTHMDELEKSHKLDTETIMELILFFMKWITNHIMISDKKYAMHINKLLSDD